jgi:hypothetical protein
MRKSKFILLSLLPILLFSGSCRIKYSFTGGSIHPEAKTASVGYFQNKATMIQPTLSQTITDALKDKLSSQTRLSLVQGSGDYHIEGEITNYTTSPMAIQGNETAALNRLTITVAVRFTDKIDPNKNFETTFSRFNDYSSSRNLSEVEDQLIKTITESLVEDIFNRAFVNW